MKRALLAAALSLLGFASAGFAQAPAEPKPGTGTLDFLVTAREGRAAPLLTAEDISLKIGGRRQRIRSVTRVTPESAPRNIVLLVDEATLYALEPIVKDAVAKLLASLKPTDTVAFYSTRGTQITLTTQHDRITAAIEKMRTGPGELWVCQRDLMRLIATDAANLPPGRSTTIAVISRGHPEAPSTAGDSEVGPCTPRRDDLRQLDESLSMAQVNFHLFTVSATNRAWGFDNIAGNTGGTSELLTWSSQDSLTRVVQSTGTYYRVTFDWDVPNDRPQRVELRAADKDLKIKTSNFLRSK